MYRLPVLLRLSPPFLRELWLGRDDDRSTRTYNTYSMHHLLLMCVNRKNVGRFFGMSPSLLRCCSGRMMRPVLSYTGPAIIYPLGQRVCYISGLLRWR